MEKYDVIIIGAGVTGTAVARELSRYQIKPVYWKERKMYVVELPKQTVRSSMPVTMQNREL